MTMATPSMNAQQQTPGGPQNGWSAMGNGISNFLGIGSGDPSNQYRNAVNNVGNQAGQFGQGNALDYRANQAGLNQSIANMGQTQNYFQNQMNGNNSVSAMQLQQGLQQGLAQQQAMAASASPNNAAMAARNAAMNMGRMSSGEMGQQAMAGLQERNQAAQGLNQAQQAQGQLQLGQSGQNMQGALGGYNAATGAYGQALGTPQQTWGQTFQKMAGAAGSALVGA